MKAYILAAGSGSRMAPYHEARPKTLLPVLNRPVISYLAGALAEAPCDAVLVAADARAADIRAVVPGSWDVREVSTSRGTADTLAAVWDNDEDALVLPGDVVLAPEDIARLTAASPQSVTDRVTLLLAPIAADETRDWIGVSLDGETVTGIVGHPREGTTHRIVGMLLPASLRTWLERTPTRFPSVEVGMMPPAERYLEAAVELWRRAGGTVRGVVAEGPAHDLDKPWQLLAANQAQLARVAGALTGDELAEGASVHESAAVDGHVVLGRNSRIGRNVTIRGNLIAGDEVVIDTGAIINGTVAVGSGSTVANGCFVEHGSVIGHNCVVSHAAELDGMIMDGVYLYHYMEIFGIVGENTDIGAATVCGSLRFDDGATLHRVKGRRELPRSHSNASYIGDFCRTGVNAILMPGCRVGPYGIVGPGVVLNRDLPPRTGIRVEQQLTEFTWGPDRYGW